MFVHAVHFRVMPKEVKDYRKDSLMWARYARKYKGFLGYHTMERLGHKNQFVSVYQWKAKKNCSITWTTYFVLIAVMLVFGLEETKDLVKYCGSQGAR